jgi:hypothetical protein
MSVIVRHPKYTFSNLSYNIALVYTTEEIGFDFHVGRICLPQPVSTFEGNQCVLTGWGSARSLSRSRGDLIHSVFTYIPDEVSPYWPYLLDSYEASNRFLLQTELMLAESVDCVQRLQKTSLGPEFKLPRTTLCAGGNSKRDTCNVRHAHITYI